ncbi:MAG: hypothetical protein OEM85_17225, partial [Gammaproteobacteria bacterium]|nr:hypothetical protein [Gammaproteobacteria bacterium]
MVLNFRFGSVAVVQKFITWATAYGQKPTLAEGNHQVAAGFNSRHALVSTRIAECKKTAKSAIA